MNFMEAPILEELRVIVGDRGLISSPEELHTYECDGLTYFRVMPRAVLLPNTTEQVQAIVRVCHRERMPFVARGSGTGLSGGAKLRCVGHCDRRWEPQREPQWKSLAQRLHDRRVDLAFAPAHEIAAAVRRRDVSPVDVVTAALARIERVNPLVNAFVALRAEEALAEAYGSPRWKPAA